MMPGLGRDMSMNPKVLEVNLIKDERQVDFDWRHNFGTLLFSLFVAVLFLVEIYIGLNWWANYEEERALATEAKFTAVSKEIKDMRTESDEILAFKQRSDISSQLLGNHIYWTNFFNWLEKNTLSTVNFAGFSGGIDGSYQLQASTKTYRDISWQTRVLLQNPSVVSVRVDSGSSEKADGEEKLDAETVNFVLDLQVDPQLFKAVNN